MRRALNFNPAIPAYIYPRHCAVAGSRYHVALSLNAAREPRERACASSSLSLRTYVRARSLACAVAFIDQPPHIPPLARAYRTRYIYIYIYIYAHILTPVPIHMGWDREEREQEKGIENVGEFGVWEMRVVGLGFEELREESWVEGE